MLWILIILVFIFIEFISIFGDYENEKIRREEKEIEEFLKERRWKK